MPSQEVAADFVDILDGRCSVSFLLVFLATLVHLSVPIPTSPTLRETPDYPTPQKGTRLSSPEAQKAPVGSALSSQALSICR